MLTILRDLLRYNREFACGAVLLAFVLVIALMSFVSPYPPQDVYLVPPDVPPCWAYPLGTTSRGQDTFWQLTFAIRNTPRLRLHGRDPQSHPVARRRPARPAISAGRSTAC